MAKDFQYDSRSLVVAVGATGTLRIPAPDVAFLDKKYIVVNGTAITNVEVLVGCGEANVNITTFTTFTSSTGNTHIINIPMPTNNLVVNINNTAGSVPVNVSFYGGSA